MQKLINFPSYRNYRFNQTWQSYKESRRLDHVIRAGFYKYGVNYSLDQIVESLKDANFTDEQLSLIRNRFAKIDPMSTLRPESVSEHSFSVIELAISISRHFPGTINPYGIMRFIRILKYHDLPEKDIGDILDDGDRNESEKNRREHAIMTEFVRNWPEHEREHFLHDYQIFQTPYSEHNNVMDNCFAEIAYLCDKIDAVFRALIYESYGHHGFCDQTLATKRDQESFDFTGTTNIVDCWAYQFIVYVLPKSSLFNDLFFGLLKAAVIDVRGQWFSWAEKLAL